MIWKCHHVIHNNCVCVRDCVPLSPLSPSIVWITHARYMPCAHRWLRPHRVPAADSSGLLRVVALFTLVSLACFLCFDDWCRDVCRDIVMLKCVILWCYLWCCNVAVRFEAITLLLERSDVVILYRKWCCDFWCWIIMHAVEIQPCRDLAMLRFDQHRVLRFWDVES